MKWGSHILYWGGGHHCPPLATPLHKTLFILSLTSNLNQNGSVYSSTVTRCVSSSTVALLICCDTVCQFFPLKCKVFTSLFRFRQHWF